MTDGFQPESIGADRTQHTPMPVPRLDPASALLFVINASAGALDVDAKRAVIESALAAHGRKGELLICGPAELARVATGRFKTLSFWDAFHGAGFGASSVGGESLFRAGRLGPLLAGSEHVAPFGCYRCAYGHPVDGDGQPDLARCRLACAGMVRYVLQREGDVAADAGAAPG